jgi:hypothetical protein
MVGWSIDSSPIAVLVATPTPRDRRATPIEFENRQPSTMA